ASGPAAPAPPPPVAPAPATPTPTPSPVAGGLEVSGVMPDRGDEAGGTYVLIRGSGFLAGGPRNTKVYFGGRQGTVVRFASDGELIVQAPGGTAGDVVDVRVIFDPGGQLVLRSAFRFVPSPP
ncbi:MAG TPA: IPT/TIG domain-containing protein, partial [Kofleriaceae bacterium]|nr:IPT/TIG domain-containing protein [Kofleriaceae bacterium]